MGSVLIDQRTSQNLDDTLRLADALYPEIKK